eukprot:gene10435-12195_t
MLIFLFLNLVLFIHVCSATYEVSFARLSDNQATKATYFLSSAIFSNGDILVGGYTTGLTDFPSAGGNDFLLQRYSYTGSLLWTKVFGDIHNNAFLAVTVDSSDNIYATGNTFIASNMNAYIAKFDPSGNMIYSIKIGGTGEDKGTAVCSTGDFFYVAAGLRNTQQGVTGSGTFFTGLARDSVGNIWATGRTNAPTYFGNSNAVPGYTDMIVQKFSSSGASLFAYLLGGASSDQALGIASDTSDNVYVTGWAQSSVDGEIIIGSLDVLLTKYSSAGTKLWTKLLGTTGYDASSAIAVDSNLGLVYVTGFVVDTLGYNVPYLLVASSADGSQLSITRFPATAGSANAYSIVTKNNVMYMAGISGANFQGQVKTGVTAGFVMKIGNGTIPLLTPTIAPAYPPTAAPSAAPSANPSVDPTATPTFAPSVGPTSSPTRVCLQWALGDFGESCSATCSKLIRSCKSKYLKDIVTQEAFYAVVGGAPAALSIVLSSEDHHAPVRTSCNYPSSVAEVTVGCDDLLPLSSYRRFCPCVDQGCDGDWFLGYSGLSCDATCTSAGGMCDAEPLSAIVNPDAFSAMVASTTVVETNELIGETSDVYCQQGINILPLAAAPSVFTLNIGAVNETLCVYPTSVSNLQGSCDMAFTDPPAQRFCNCKQTSASPQSTHRTLLSATVIPESSYVPNQSVGTVKAAPRLRGRV